LPLVLDADDLVRRCSLGRQALVQPAENRRDCRILLAQTLDQLNSKSRRERGAFESPEQQWKRIGGVTPKTEKPVGERVCFLARCPARHNPIGQPPEVVNEHHAQRDRHRPKLSDREWLDALICLDEAAKRFGVEAAVGVGDEGPGQPEHARVALKMAVGQLGQLPVESDRKILPDLAELFLDDVKVVDEPFGGWSDGPFFPDHFGNGAIGLEQSSPVVLHERKQRSALVGIFGDLLGSSEALGVLPEPLDAEQL
jgi:hypothetical protein